MMRSARHPRAIRWPGSERWILWLLAIMIGLLSIAPLARLIWAAIAPQGVPDSERLLRLLNAPRVLRAAGNTLFIALGATAISLLLGILAAMRVLATGVHMQVTQLGALERATRDHALNRLDYQMVGVVAFTALAHGAGLDPTGITRVVVEQLLLFLTAAQGYLFGIDNNDMVAAINVRGELRLVLATQAQSNDDGKTTQSETFGIDQDPVLRHLRGLQRESRLHDTEFHIRTVT